MDDEKPGSTRIVSILPEGTHVTKGQVVCELDASAFDDELQAQLVRWLKAKSWVDQARSILEVSEISLREYRDGIYPQDLQLIRQYIQTCKIEKERSERNVNWSRDMFKKGFRTAAQLKADELNNQEKNIALEEAEGMLERLAKFTGPKNIKSLEAKIKAIESDKKNQEASFQLETQHRDRLQRNIDRCTLRAPDDGIVVYMNETNRWGGVDVQIDQGVTVREGQRIFQLPDPKSMRIKARINETKMGQLMSGQRAMIKVDAFPDRLMQGTVAEITAISTPVNGLSDVRIYFAIVNIDQGNDDLRPGLTAEVFLKCDSHTNVTRVPIQAVRSIDGKHYVALHQTPSQAEQNSSWKWKRVELGLSDPNFVEVVSGVKRGERVVANSLALPEPESIPEEQAGASSVANVSMQPRESGESALRQQMLPFLERTTRRQRVFKRVILGATLVVLASMIGVSQSARYRLLLDAGQTRDVLARRLFGLEPDRTEVETQWRLRRPSPQPRSVSLVIQKEYLS